MPRASDKYLDTTYLKQYEHIHINTASAQFIQQVKTAETLSFPLSREDTEHFVSSLEKVTSVLQ